jgi:sulfur carrier protein ThiS
MKIKVFVDRLGKSKNLDVKNISEIFEKLKLNMEEYIVVKEDALVTENTKLKDGDELKFLSVVSGG